MATVTIKNKKTGKTIRQFYSARYSVFKGKVYIYKEGPAKGKRPLASYPLSEVTWTSR